MDRVLDQAEKVTAREVSIREPCHRGCPSPMRSTSSATSEPSRRETGELGGPCCGRVGGDREDVRVAGMGLYDEQDIQTAKVDGVNVEEIDCQ